MHLSLDMTVLSKHRVLESFPITLRTEQGNKMIRKGHLLIALKWKGSGRLVSFGGAFAGSLPESGE